MAEASSGPVAEPFDPDAPNVVIIVLDDLGFAQLGSYGSDLETPNLDRLAQRGVRFTNFHTTAICSPTRACLLTGRNHHRVGMGMLPDLPVDFPGYRGVIPPEAGTAAQILKAEGYATFAVGKWHLTPRDQRATGPYDTWPSGYGFDRYYGFLNGETNQWTPNLVRDNSHVEPPADPEDGYHLDADLADEALARLGELAVTQPDRPFLLWYATAAPHAPHQAPPEWIDRYRGRFDDGWDVWREGTLERQKALGVVPPGAELSPRPDWVEAWGDLGADQRRLYARMMEVFAAFVSHADHHIGRVLDALPDNTVVCLVSDNGCSAEGGPHGSYNQLAHYISDDADDLDDELAHIDDLGGWRSSGHYPWGWALAGNTPFRRWKRYTFEGGVRDPFVIAGPGIDDAGTVRHQYAHVTDVLPTLLDLIGIAPPDDVAGVDQMSMDGASFRTVLDDGDAAETRSSQYFECWGSRAMYAEGWKAVTDHVNQLTAAERDHLAGSDDFATDRWALFHVAEDPTESVDLAVEHPDKLAEMLDRWEAEAERNHVLPLGDGLEDRLAHLYMPWLDVRGRFVLRPGDKVHEVAGPILPGGFTMEARFTTALDPSATGVLCEQGDWLSGWAWYLADGEVRWCRAGRAGDERVAAPLPDEWRTLGVLAAPTAGRRVRRDVDGRRRRARRGPPRARPADGLGAGRGLPDGGLGPTLPGRGRLPAPGPRALRARRGRDHRRAPAGPRTGGRTR